MCNQVLNQSVAASMKEAKAASTAKVSQNLQTNWKLAKLYRVQNATHFSDISSMVSSFI